MKTGVVVFPGSNCDHDTYHVLKHVLGTDARFIWHGDAHLHDCDVIVLPGGFSYGDYLRTGAIARFSPVMQAVKEFARRGGFVLGICNGFQILQEAGLLPGAMLRNRGLKFICRPVDLRAERTDLAFTRAYEPGQVLRMPIAHNEGSFYVSPEELNHLERNGRVVLQSQRVFEQHRGADQRRGKRDGDDVASRAGLRALPGIRGRQGNLRVPPESRGIQESKNSRIQEWATRPFILEFLNSWIL